MKSADQDGVPLQLSLCDQIVQAVADLLEPFLQRRDLFFQLNYFLSRPATSVPAGRGVERSLMASRPCFLKQLCNWLSFRPVVDHIPVEEEGEVILGGMTVGVPRVVRALAVPVLDPVEAEDETQSCAPACSPAVSI